MQPRYGPNEGKGLIYFYGEDFEDDFPGAQLGCKLGESIGTAWKIDGGLMKCIVPKMDLVNDGEFLPVYLALNSHSWVSPSGPLAENVNFKPYGIT